jgi:AraC-like DNA-binding protein
LAVSFLAVVRQIFNINAVLIQPCSSQRIAEKVGIRESRVAAKLAEAGTSFSELLRDARRTLALRYLRDQAMLLTDIALRLGYSELSAFSRAFHNWAGMSPQTHRQQSTHSANERRGAGQ